MSNATVAYAVWVERQIELRRLAGALGLVPADVDDVMQTVAVTAVNQCPAELPGAAAFAWLVRTLINATRLHQRRSAQQRRTHDAYAARLPLPADPTSSASSATPTAASMDRAERAAAVHTALAALPERLATPLVLRYFMNLAPQEIAAILELPGSTVRGQLREGRLQLAAALRRWSDAP